MFFYDSENKKRMTRENVIYAIDCSDEENYKIYNH